MTIQERLCLLREELGLLGELIETARLQKNGGWERADGYMDAAQEVTDTLEELSRYPIGKGEALYGMD